MVGLLLRDNVVFLCSLLLVVLLGAICIHLAYIGASFWRFYILCIFAYKKKKTFLNKVEPNQ